jgi:O-antigen ligase
VAVSLPGFLQDRFLTIVDPSYGPKNAQESAQGRLAGLLLGAKLWNQSPLLGVGPGAFTAASGSQFNPHNVYGQVISELGSLGTLGWIVVLFCFLGNWLETRRNHRQLRGQVPDFPYLVSRAVALDVALLLLMGFAGHNLYRYNWLWLAAFQVGALHCLRVKQTQRQTDPRPVLYLAAPRAGLKIYPRPAPGT